MKKMKKEGKIRISIFIFIYTIHFAYLPRDATGLSAVCDCGISGSYSLTIFEGAHNI